MGLDLWNLTLRVNLTGTFLVVRDGLAHLLAAGGGAIVTIGSIASVVAGGYSSSYDASKGGVLQLTRAVAAEYADRGIRANCVLPGAVSTNLKAHSEESVGPRAGTGTRPSPPKRVDVPMNRHADPSEIAAVVSFLCSDDASFLTGGAVPVDGGHTAV
jgi:NAD(P)-dependent dehydrogenase (short-subunit alcohol dehydrogenase family)